MKVITYFAITLLSILIQFSLVDLIQNSLMIEDKNIVDLNLTSQKKPFSEVLNQHNALYFKTSAVMKRNVKSTTAKLVATNDPATTIVYEVALEEDEASTTESYETTDSSTEYENVTDFSIFAKKNESIPVTTQKPNTEIHFNGICPCDLLVNQCDLNCCCDGDCTSDDRKLFECPNEVSHKRDDYFCPFEERSLLVDNIDNLFCVARTNLPDKRVVDPYKYKKVDVEAVINSALKWRGQGQNGQEETNLVFTPKNYTSGDPIWLLHKENVSYLDFPVSSLSDYCDGRLPVRFFKKSKSRCKVTFQDLEIFNILKNIEEYVVVTVTDELRNTTTLNCSSLYCIHWQLITCNETTCDTYNKSLHQPACTDDLCTGLAHKIAYNFHVNSSKITNATIYFYTKTYSIKTQFLMQHIEIDFFIAPRSNETRIIKLSGNPGYEKGYPIIASYSKENHTNGFFNTELHTENKLFYPDNAKGECVLNKVSRKIIPFGVNKRCKCRYRLSTKAAIDNATATCQSLWNEAKRLINMRKHIFISPFGNPKDMIDSDWIKINEITSQVPILGQLNAKDSTIYCNNVVTTISYVFGYADVAEAPDDGKIKILSANTIVTAENRTFKTEDVSLVATFETMFIDVTKPPVYEYAGSPNLHIHLPKDFFFPFKNKTCDLTSNILLIILCFLNLT